jgi:hypothetical protein
VLAHQNTKITSAAVVHTCRRYVSHSVSAGSTLFGRFQGMWRSYAHLLCTSCTRAGIVNSALRESTVLLLLAAPEPQLQQLTVTCKSDPQTLILCAVPGQVAALQNIQACRVWVWYACTIMIATDLHRTAVLPLPWVLMCTGMLSYMCMAVTGWNLCW